MAKEVDVQIRPVDITGPGVLHKSGADMLHVPQKIEAEVAGFPWKITFTLSQSAGDDPIPEVTELRFSRRPGGMPISADVTRLFPLGEATAKAVQQASSRWVETSPGTFALDPALPSADRVRAGTKRQQRRVTDDVLSQATDAYLEAKRQGRKDHLMFIADACHVSRATAHRYLNRAIEAGLITQEGK